MSHKTQIAWVKQTLRSNGRITRNEALRNYISRLGALINLINKEPDWDIRGHYERNGNSKDYVYKVYSMPIVRKLVWSEERQAMVYQPEPPKQDNIW